MPRKTRIDIPGALHHAMIRGLERRKLFGDDEDRGFSPGSAIIRMIKRRKRED